MGFGKKRSRGGGSAADEKMRKREAEERWKNQPRDESRRGTYSLSVKTDNKRFAAFYKAQRFVDEGDDWDAFVKTLSTPLPACFRINSDYAFAEELRNQLLKFVGQRITVEGHDISPVEQIAWYPNGNGYKLGTDKKTIRKLPALNDLHKWMMQHTDNGNITRQEAVSMVPPLALNVSPHHRCLDMCAAPGSKTSQLLEIVTQCLHSTSRRKEEENPATSVDGSAAANETATKGEAKQGIVVANDPNTDRAYMLVHQCKRLNSPLLAVTTHNGQNFPTIFSSSSSSSAERIQNATDETANLPTEFFDRVLCDVPCSGDGTLRKNPLIWEKWCVSMATTLHPLQLMIAQRGVQLLQPGGLLVYSTCSMSPYEDEAVVAELLRTSNGTLELVDARAEYLSKFRSRKGLSTWHVLDDYLSLKAENQERRDQKMREKKARSQEQRVKREQQQQQEQEQEQQVQEVQDEQENDVIGEEVKSSAPAEEGGEAAESRDSGENRKVEESASMSGSIKEQELSAAAGPQTDADADGAMKLSADEQPVDPDNTDSAEDREYSAGATAGSATVPAAPLPEDLLVRACVQQLGMAYFPSYASVPSHLQRKMRPSLFPPSEEERAWMHLERCLRCAPQDEDTGGFFVATLRKIPKPAKPPKAPIVAPASAEPTAATATAVDSAVVKTVGSTMEVVALSGEGEGAFPDAEPSAAGSDAATGGSAGLPIKGLVDYRQWDVAAYDKIRDFYGLTEDIPAESMFVREDFTVGINKQNSNGSNDARPNKKPKTGVVSKTVYFFPRSVREFLRGDRAGRLKIVNAGLKIFERKTDSRGNHEYRLLQDGIVYLAPYITKRKISVKIQDFCNLLGGGLVSFATLSTATVHALAREEEAGVVICSYTYDPCDVIPPAAETSLAARSAETTTTTAATMTAAAAESGEEAGGEALLGGGPALSYGAFQFFLICSKGRSDSRSLNVMVSKLELESLNHQLAALNVLRPKVFPPKWNSPAPDAVSAPSSSSSAAAVPVSVAAEAEATDCDQVTSSPGVKSSASAAGDVVQESSA